MSDVEKAEALPEAQEGALHVASDATGDEVLVWGPGVMLRFDPELGGTLDEFVKLLREAQQKAITQRMILKAINVEDPPTWIDDLPNHGPFDTERYRK